MTSCRLVFFSVALVALAFLADATYAQQKSEADEAITQYLAKQKSGNEEAQAQETLTSDLNGDGKPEVVVVWTLMGPTYWRYTLTVFSKTATVYAPIASLNLDGEAKLSSVKNGIIFVDQKVLGKNDPLCCPSIKKLGKYRLLGKKLVEVK